MSREREIENKPREIEENERSLRRGMFGRKKKKGGRKEGRMEGRKEMKTNRNT